MNVRTTLLSLAALPLMLSIGCLRSYNAVPLNPAFLTSTTKTETQVEIKYKAFLTPAEVSEKFGTKLAEERQVIPVQVLISNKGTATYRIVRASMVVEETASKTRLAALTVDQMYELGRHGYGQPTCGILFGGILGLPCLITTLSANDKIRADYLQKLLQDTILEPGKEVTGAVFFDPEPAHLSRLNGNYKLLIEMVDTKTNTPLIVGSALN